MINTRIHYASEMDYLLISTMLIQVVCNGLGVIANSLLLYLLSKKTPKYLITYSVVIYNLALCDVLTSLGCLFVLQRQYYSSSLIYAEVKRLEPGLQLSTIPIQTLDVLQLGYLFAKKKINQCFETLIKNLDFLYSSTFLTQNPQARALAVDGSCTPFQLLVRIPRPGQGSLTSI